MEILKVENLTKKYGKKDTEVVALDNVSFSVEKGEFTKMANKEENLKGVNLPFDTNSFILKLGTAFIMSINTDTFQVGKEYYVLNNRFERAKNWEMLTTTKQNI